MFTEDMYLQMLIDEILSIKITRQKIKKPFWKSSQVFVKANTKEEIASARERSLLSIFGHKNDEDLNSVGYRIFQIRS